MRGKKRNWKHTLSARTTLPKKTIWGHPKKSCSKGILDSCGLSGAKRVFAIEYLDTGLFLCKCLRYLVVIKIMDIRHKICHIYYNNADLYSIFLQKDSLYCCYMCVKFSSTCKIIFSFSCILSSALWDNFLWMTLYLVSWSREKFFQSA